MSVISEKFLPASLTQIINSIQDLRNSLIDTITELNLQGFFGKIDSLEVSVNDIQGKIVNIEEIVTRIDNLENQNSQINDNLEQLKLRLENVEAISQEFFGA